MSCNLLFFFVYFWTFERAFLFWVAPHIATRIESGMCVSHEEAEGVCGQRSAFPATVVGWGREGGGDGDARDMTTTLNNNITTGFHQLCKHQFLNQANGGKTNYMKNLSRPLPITQREIHQKRVNS